MLKLVSSTTHKAIMRTLNVTENTAKLIKKTCLTANTPNDVDYAMEKVQILLEGHSIESLECNNVDYWKPYYMNIYALYINEGDTYIPTLIYEVPTHTFYLTTVGDYIEAKEYKGIEFR